MKLTPLFVSSLIVSAGLHVALVVSSYSTAIMLPGSTGSVIAVKLEEKIHEIVNPAKKQTSQKKPGVQPKIKQQKEAKQEVQTSQDKAVKKTEKPAETAQHIAHKNIEENKTEYSQEKQLSESRARVVSVIYKELKQHFTYPKLAVRRNWQGKVLLSLRVTSSGQIKNIQLTKGSGYSILDQAAIKALRNIGNLPYTSTWLVNDIELKIPVIYKLTKG